MSPVSGASRPERRWRPSDADRDRYAEAISEAFTAGRITVDDMQSRTALVYEATSIADLDALVEDIPGVEPPPVPVEPVKPAPRYGARVVVGLVCAVLVATGAGIMFGASEAEDGADSEMMADPEPVAPGLEPADVEVPEIATEKLGMLTKAGLVEMWDTMSASDVDEIKSIKMWTDWAQLSVRASTERLGLDEISYEGGFATPREWQRSYTEQEGGFFGWGDVSPKAVAKAIAASPEAIGDPDAPVTHAAAERSVFADDQIVIVVYLDSSGSTSPVWWSADGSTRLFDDS